MIISVTYIELRSGWKFFRLSSLALGITRQMKKAPGYRDFRRKGLPFTRHQYTLSLWETREQMLAFVRSGEHMAAMKESAALSTRLHTHSWEGDALPDWDTAIRMLDQGRKHTF